MRSVDFITEAMKRSLLLYGTGQAGESPTARFLPSPLVTPKDPRSIHELVNLTRTFAHPTEWERISAELRRRLGNKTLLANTDAKHIPWHHPWMLPKGEHADDYITLGEYLAQWRK